MTIDYADELFEADLARYFQTSEAFEDFNLELYQEIAEQQEILKGA